MKKRTILILGGIVVLTAMGALAVQRVMRTSDLEEVATVPVREGIFRATLSAEGTLQALRSRIITSDVWGATIVNIVPEGTVVNEGDPLVWFDRTQLEQRWRDRQNRLETQKSQLVQQKENIELDSFQKNLAMKRVVAQLEHTRARLAEARAKLIQQQELFNNKLTSRSEAEQAELNLRQAEIQVQRAKTDSTKAAEDQASGVKIQEAQLRRTEADVERAQREVEEVEQDLEKTLIRAPYSGMIMYFSDRRRGKPKAGTQVWKGQKLLEVPDLSEVTVEIPIRERDISWVRPHQKVLIRLDAFPELVLHGSVYKISTLAEEEGRSTDRFGQSKGSEGVSVFTVTLLIDKEDLADKQAMVAAAYAAASDTTGSMVPAALDSAVSPEATAAADTSVKRVRPSQIIPGMTASVEILVDALPQALYVPLEAAIEKDSTRVVYVMEGDHPKPREVVFGIWNENDIVVKKGLEQGERVCLRDPTVKLTIPEEKEATSERPGAMGRP